METIPYFYDNINRSAVGIRLKQPFIDWHNNVYPDSKIGTIEEGNSYLLRCKNDGAEITNWLRVHFDEIFQNELNDWHTNANDWPQKRNYKMFLEWFDVTVFPIVLDLDESDIVKE